MKSWKFPKSLLQFAGNGRRTFINSKAFQCFADKAAVIARSAKFPDKQKVTLVLLTLLHISLVDRPLRAVYRVRELFYNVSSVVLSFGFRVSDSIRQLPVDLCKKSSVTVNITFGSGSLTAKTTIVQMYRSYQSHSNAQNVTSNRFEAACLPFCVSL